jgi:hypothetical protein
MNNISQAHYVQALLTVTMSEGPEIALVPHDL